MNALAWRLAHCSLFLVIAGRFIGRGCATLTINVIYRKRAWPLAWIEAKVTLAQLYTWPY